MTTRITRFIAFLVASAFVLKDLFQILILNILNVQNTIVYEITDSMGYAGIALCVVGVSIFLKRNIWAYLFFLVIIASFFPLVSFSNFSFAIYIGSLKLDLIPLTFLIVHVLLNIHLVRIPEMSYKQKEESTNEKVEFYMKNLESKTDEELVQMNIKELVQEAVEARKILMEKRSI